MDNIIITTLELPLCVRGVTALQDCGKYNIYINSRYTVKIRNEILRQELCKVENFDFADFKKFEFEE